MSIQDEKRKAFREGAMQMQGRIVAWLAMNRHMEIAPKILELQPPDYCEPEILVISTPNDK